MAVKRRSKTKTARKKPQKTIKKAKRKKIIFLVIDGLADRMKRGKTPLETANKPNMDWFAANGACGQLELISSPKMEVASQFANVSLLGYDPSRYYLKRGPLEAAGADLPFVEGNLALRCNFATVSNGARTDDMRVMDRRAGRAVYGLDDIARYINQHVEIGCKYLFMRTYGHRAVLILQEKLSDEIEGNDRETGKKVGRITALSPDAERSAQLVQTFVDKTRDVMQYHEKNSERMDRGLLPANYVLTRGAGNKIFALPHFARRWKIKNAVCIAENGVMKATCMTAGFSSINVPEIIRSDTTAINHEATLDFIFENIDSALAEYDFVYAHVKGPDEAAHDKDPEKKRKTIEAIDARLEPFKKFNGTLVLTCDHITSSETGRHERGPVPVLVYGKRKDTVKKFDEEAVKKGSLKKMSGRDLMKFIFSK